MEGLAFYKSSHTNAECVEVANTPTTDYVRDSKDQAGPMLAVPRIQWKAFVASAKTGKFD